MAKASRVHAGRGAAPAAPKKKWTFMVYLAGDNNLDANGVDDLGEMKKVGSGADLSIVAQFDRRGRGKPTRRFYLRRGTNLGADTVMSLPETNTGSPESLVGFVRWAATKYPAEHYALVLWNHGAGWDDADIYRSSLAPRSLQRRAQGRLRHSFFRTSRTTLLRGAVGGARARAILFDDDARDFLDNLEMKKALLEIKRILRGKVDVLGMDACLMSMAEVLFQMRDGVACAVGSEETEPAEGWPYDTVLQALAARPGLRPVELAGLIVDKYIASYAAADSVTQSAADLSRVRPLTEAVTELAAALTAALERPESLMAVMTSRLKAQAYEVRDNVDLTDFCQLLAAKAEAGAQIAQACRRVAEAVGCTNGLVRNSRFKGAGVKNSHGLAIYFPTMAVSSLYARLDFARVTGWGKFLEKYVSATQAR